MFCEGRDVEASKLRPLAREPVPQAPKPVLRVGTKTRLGDDCVGRDKLPGLQYEPALHLMQMEDPSVEIEPAPHHVQDEEPASEKKFGGQAKQDLLIS